MLHRFAKLCDWTASAVALLLVVGGAIVGFLDKPWAGYSYLPLIVGAGLAVPVFFVGAAIRYVVIGPDENDQSSLRWFFSFIFGFVFFFAAVVAGSVLLGLIPGWVAPAWATWSNANWWAERAAIAFFLQCASGGLAWYLGLRQLKRQHHEERSDDGARREPVCSGTGPPGCSPTRGASHGDCWPLGTH
jgi:hypothetical protein